METINYPVFYHVKEANFRTKDALKIKIRILISSYVHKNKNENYNEKYFNYYQNNTLDSEKIVTLFFFPAKAST